jgi:large subunit ribosomal protein L35Ae
LRQQKLSEKVVLEGHQGFILNKLRLYVKALFTGFRRGLTNQYEKQALLQIDGVKDRKAAAWYFGKRVVYVQKGKKSYKVE